MIYEVVILPLAETETHEAALYYEEQKAGLGLAFLDELEVARQHLSDHPNTTPLFRKKKPSVRFLYAAFHIN